MTYLAKALVRTERGKLEIENNTLLCCCPDCHAPMTIRVWLCLANCWRCGTSIQLTFEQIRHLKKKTPQRELPVAAAESKKQSNVDSIVSASVQPIKIPWPFIFSFLLNALIILVLALLFFTQVAPRKVIDLELSLSRPGNQNRSVMDLIPIAVQKPEVAKVAKTPDPIARQSETDTSGVGDDVTFFNTKATGNRFVYIVDRSGSMNTVGTNLRGSCRSYQARYEHRISSRFDFAKRELIRSIASLNPSQEFYVFLFSNEATFMFDSREELIPSLVSATPANKKDLSNWLSDCVVHGGTDPTMAIQIALNMEPDAVFLLSDGAFMIPRGHARPLSIVPYNREVPIHTIAYEDEVAQENLQQISQRTGGEFRFIPYASRVKQILSSGNSRDVAHLLKSFQELPTQCWSWEKRLMFARLILDAAREPLPDRQSYFDALQCLAFGLKPHRTNDADEDWGIPVGRQQWLDFWNEADSSYRDLLSSKPVDVAKFEFGLMAGLQRICDQFVANDDGSIRERDQRDWYNLLNFSTRLSIGLGPSRGKASSKFANVDFPAVEALATMGLLTVDRNVEYCDVLFRRHSESIDKIAIAQTLIEFQNQFGVADESHFMLEQIFKDQSPNIDATNLKRKWEKLFDRILNDRHAKARNMYRKFQRTSPDRRRDLAQELIEAYPETSYARIVRKRIGIQ